MKKLYTYLFLLAPILFTNKLKAQVDVSDSLALVDLYNNTDGTHWTNNSNWLTAPISSWFGVLVWNNRVTSLRLSSNNLNGTLPVTLGNLTELTTLEFTDNKLSGHIPASIGNMIKLQSLALSYNQFTGSIPSSFKNFIFLYGFALSHNHLSGKVPAELGDIGYIEYFDVSFNHLSDTIPASLGKISGMGYFYVNNNQLSGNIPSTFGNFKSNRFLTMDFSNNRLSGSIPNTLSDNHRFLFYHYLSLSHNELTGSIPSDFGNGYGFTHLDLSYNKLSGKINYDLNVSDYLDLSNNLFSGKVSENFFLEGGPKHIDLSNNNFGGKIPSAIDNSYGIIYLDLSNNNLNGSISSSLSKLTNIETLNLKNNNLTDSIPSFLGNLTNLKVLFLSGNRLQGKIPSTLSALSKLEKFDVRGNRLKGPVPTFFTSLQLLTSINLLENYFTFDGIETLAQHNFDSLKYYAEKNIDIHQNNNRLSVYAGGTLSNNTYKWYKGGSLVATITGDSTYTPTGGGNYYVNVSNSIATELTLFSDTIQFNTANTSSAIASSQTIKNNFLIYPNPAKTIATVLFNATGNCTITLTDVSGNILQTKTVTAKGKTTIQLDVSKYATGIYFVSILNEGKQVHALRLNKQ